MHRWNHSVRRALTRVLAAVTLAASLGIALPAAPASAAAAPLPSDVTFASTPVIDPSGLFMTSRGLDGSILFSSGSPSTNGYSDFFNIGGSIIGDPTAVVAPEGAQVFARSAFTNAAVTNLVVSYRFPTGFQEIPGLAISSEVTAVKIPPRGSRPPMIRIFARDLETGILYTNLLVQGAPQGWVPLGIYTTSEVTAAVIPPGGLDIDIRLVVRSFDGRLWSMIFNNTTGPVTSWAPLGTLAVFGNPVLANEGFTSFFRGNEVFVRGPGGALFTWNFDNPGWVSMGGVFQGDPGVAIPSDDGLHVYVRGTNNRIFVTRRPPGGSFGGYINLGGQATSNIAASGGARGQRALVDQFITRSLENRMSSRILPRVNAAYGGFFFFGGPLHG
ncbi:hypothetical protein ACIA8G_04995 [Lentzea sp. NPDC051213]|uniref:hypothetical protein n=1 Tax=Lentzea sp. NPDC051213 TaxID=3364126 RepID=UPI0037A49E72